MLSLHKHRTTGYKIELFEYTNKHKNETIT